MTWKAVIFDLDGTLTDTLQTIAVSVDHGLAELGLPGHTTDAYRLMVGEGVEELCRRALPDGKQHELENLLRRVRAFYDQNILLHVRLYDGVLDLLRSLRQRGAHLAVLSNKPDSLAQATVDGMGLRPYFDVVLGASDSLPRKPDPEAAWWVAGQLALDREQVLFVGDTPIDVNTARAAGMASVAVTWGFRTREELLPSEPSYLVDQPGQVLGVFDSGPEEP
ncbi:MAG: HAD-IA family hydrolase [Planctomycetota bacterium]